MQNWNNQNSHSCVIVIAHRKPLLVAGFWFYCTWQICPKHLHFSSDRNHAEQSQKAQPYQYLGHEKNWNGKYKLPSHKREIIKKMMQSACLAAVICALRKLSKSSKTLPSLYPVHMTCTLTSVSIYWHTQQRTILSQCTRHKKTEKSCYQSPDKKTAQIYGTKKNPGFPASWFSIHQALYKNTGTSLYWCTHLLLKLTDNFVTPKVAPNYLIMICFVNCIYSGKQKNSWVD